MSEFLKLSGKEGAMGQCAHVLRGTMLVNSQPDRI